jgi:hypothetical protein
MDLVIALGVSITGICLFLGWMELVSIAAKLDHLTRLVEELRGRRLEGDEWKDL